MRQLFLIFLFSNSISLFGQAPKADSIFIPDSKFIRKNLIGQWKDQNSTTTFYKNYYRTNYDDGEIETGQWSIERNLITFKSEGPQSFSVYTILSFTPTKFEYQLIAPSPDTTKWIAYKIIKAKN